MNGDRWHRPEAGYPDERFQGITAVSNCDPLTSYMETGFGREGRQHVSTAASLI